ncbi:MAG: hypothetical protein ABGW85_00460 [Sulfurimonas sp.]
MSIQDDVKYVKTELSGDEKVLESAFKLETLYKKYKFVIWGASAAVILFFLSQTVMQSMKEAKLEEANKAFLTLQKTPDNADTLATLKAKNPALFELYSFSKAAQNSDVKTLETLTSSKNEIIADASKYTAAVIDKKPVDSKLYAEMALFEEAYLAIKSGDTTSAKAKLELIDERSSLQMLTQLLEHSMIKAK